MDLLLSQGIAANQGWLDHLGQMRERYRKLSVERIRLTHESFQRNRLILGGLTVLAVGLGLVLAILIARGLIRPLHAFAQVLEAVGSGNLRTQAPDQSRDELGAMGRALNKTITAMRDSLQRIQDASARLASGTTQLASSAEELHSTTEANARNLELLRAATERSVAAIHELGESAREINRIAADSRIESEGSLSAAEGGAAAGAKADQAVGAIASAMGQMGGGGAGDPGDRQADQPAEPQRGPSRRPRPGPWARASRWWPKRCASWPNAVAPRPGTSTC